MAALSALEPPAGDASVVSYRVMKSIAMNVRHNFSTPNAENTRDTLMTVGFDPWPAWSWPDPGGTSQQQQDTPAGQRRELHRVAR